jgi:hypothetical protein
MNGVRVSMGWWTSRYSGSGPAAACVQAGNATLWANGEITLGSGRPGAPGGPAQRVVLRPAGIKAAGGVALSVSSRPVTPGAWPGGNGDQLWKESGHQATAHTTGRGAWVRERTGARPGTAAGAGVVVTAARLGEMFAEAVVDAEERLAQQADRFPWQPPPGAQEVCLTQVRALVDRLFPGGIASTTFLDDRVVESEPSTRRLLGHPHADWSPVSDWGEILEQIEELGKGGAGLVVHGRPGPVGHAFAIVHTSDGVRIADPKSGEIKIPGDLTTLLAPVRARALIITPTGEVTRPPQATSTAANTGLEALIDPVSRHIDMHRGYGAYQPAGPSTYFTPGAGSSFQPAPPQVPVPPAIRVVNTARQFVGHLRWGGSSGPSPRDGWQISETTGRGDTNDFARWVLGSGPPGPNATMASHELILFAAHQAGVIDLTWLRRVYGQASGRAQTAYAGFLNAHPGAGLQRAPRFDDGHGNHLTAPELAFQNTLIDYLAPAPRQHYRINPRTGIGGPDIPTGHVILFDGINGHAALSLGTRDRYGHQEILSLWNRPQAIPRAPGERHSAGFLQKTTIEELAHRFRTIEHAAPPWVSPATMVVAAARQLEGKLRWRGPYGPARRLDWRISETTVTGYPNDMALWLHDKGMEPGDSSTMNCWDALFFSAYRAGYIDKAWIQEHYKKVQNATKAAFEHYKVWDHRTGGFIDRMTTDRHGQQSSVAAVAFQDAMMEGLVKGPLQRYTIDPVTGIGSPDIPAGYIIFINGVGGHVLISAGTRDAQGRLEVLNHYAFPFTLPGEPNAGYMQRATLEETARFFGQRTGARNLVIEYGAPSWDSAPAVGPLGGPASHSGSGAGGSSGYQIGSGGSSGFAGQGYLQTYRVEFPDHASVTPNILKEAMGRFLQKFLTTTDTQTRTEIAKRIVSLGRQLDTWSGASRRGKNTGEVPSPDSEHPDVPQARQRKTLTGPDGVVWSSSSFSEDQCVNIAVVWMGGA